MRALELLGEPTNQWDTLIIFNMTGKLDKRSLREWEECKNRMRQDQTPSLLEFKQFLKSRADLLDTIQPISRETKGQVKYKSFVASGGEKQIVCSLCHKNHAIYNCSTFLDLNVNDRSKKIKQLKLCFNCLKPNHVSRKCNASTCRKCKGKHHTLIHFDRDACNVELKENINEATSAVENLFRQYLCQIPKKAV